MDCNTPGLPVHHQHPELTQTHVRWVSDAIQPSYPLSPFPPTFNLSQHQGLFQWVGFLHQEAKVLEFQLQHRGLGRSPGRLPTPVFLGFVCGSAGKKSTCNAGDLGLIPGLGRSPGEGKGYPLQYSGLEMSMNCILHGITESDTTEWLSHTRTHTHPPFKMSLSVSLSGVYWNNTCRHLYWENSSC